MMVWTDIDAVANNERMKMPSRVEHEEAHK